MANLFVQVTDAEGRPIDRCRVVCALVGRPNPDGTLENDDKVTREGGNVSWLGNWIPQVEHYEVRVNTYEPLAAYKSQVRRITRADFERQQLFVLERTGEPPTPPPTDEFTTIRCPHDAAFSGYGTTGEWKTMAHTLAPAGIMEPNSGPQPNLDAFDRALRAVPVPTGFSPCQLQFMSGGQKKKPRIHLPVKPQVNVADCGMFSRVVDIGSFGLPFFHSSDGNTDVWQLTGRPPSSQW